VRLDARRSTGRLYACGRGSLFPRAPEQIAAREMEIVRIRGALQRAEELSDDVAAAIDGLSEVG
jgi:hypothetical protein